MTTDKIYLLLGAIGTIIASVGAIYNKSQTAKNDASKFAFDAMKSNYQDVIDQIKSLKAGMAEDQAHYDERIKLYEVEADKLRTRVAMLEKENEAYRKRYGDLTKKGS